METSKQWQLALDAAERYERILVPTILGPAARALVARSGLRKGGAVADIGCGTGAATRFAAEDVGPSGRVAGVDVNEGMIDVAKSTVAVPGAAVEWFRASAHDLPFADGEFDVVICAQTLQFLEERPRALEQMHRILEPGGRLAVSLWCDIRENPYFRALVDAITENIGPETAAGLRAAFGLSDAHAIRALFAEAGFRNVDAMVERLDLDLPKPRDFVPRHVSATPMSAGFQAASEEARLAVVREMSEQLAPYETKDGIRVRFSTHVVTGVK